ncbi:hypothetical protein MMC27_001210 [Xylographa pallens]|nr:hypothetical protein [Xylographa pallens]
MPSSSSHNPYASTYERMSGNCTRLVAAHIVSTISPPITSSSYILDSACGTGIVSEQIKIQHPNARIMATDLSPAMIEETQRRIETEGWTNMQTDILDVRSLSTLPDSTFTHVIINMGLLAPGDPESGTKVTREVFRVLKPGGVAVLSIWADRVWPTAFFNAARGVRPHERPQHGMAQSPDVMRGSWLLKQLEDAGFGNNVELRPFRTHTSAGSLEELVDNMMLAKGFFFAGYSDEELGRAKELLEAEARKLRTFEEGEGGVRIGMKALIGVGWKRDDGQGEQEGVEVGVNTREGMVDLLAPSTSTLPIGSRSEV